MWVDKEDKTRSVQMAVSVERHIQQPINVLHTKKQTLQEINVF